MNAAVIARHLNIAESAVIRCEEWARVLFVVIRGLGARFVSKKVMIADFTDALQWRDKFEDENCWGLSILKGEKVENYEVIESQASMFLPASKTYKVGNSEYSYKEVRQAISSINWKEYSAVHYNPKPFTDAPESYWR